MFIDHGYILHRWLHLTTQKINNAEQKFRQYGEWSLLILHPISVNYNLNPTCLKAMFHRQVESTNNDKYLQLLLMAQTN